MDTSGIRKILLVVIILSNIMFLVNNRKIIVQAIYFLYIGLLHYLFAVFLIGSILILFTGYVRYSINHMDDLWDELEKS